MEFNFGHWLKVTLESASVVSVVGALTQILPPITALLGAVYWSIMIYKALKKKDK